MAAETSHTHEINIFVQLHEWFSKEQIWWFHAFDKLLEPFSWNGCCLHFGSRASHEAVCTFESHSCSWTNLVISCVWEDSAAFQFKRKLPSFCAQNNTWSCRCPWKSHMKLNKFDVFMRLRGCYSVLAQTDIAFFCAQIVAWICKWLRKSLIKRTHVVISCVWEVSVIFCSQNANWQKSKKKLFNSVAKWFSFLTKHTSHKWLLKRHKMLLSRDI